MIDNKEHYINLSTLKRNGVSVKTPVWFTQEDKEKIYYIYTLKKSGKVKRIRNFSKVQLALCNFRGKVKGKWMNAHADLISDPEEIKLAFWLLRKKYGIIFRIGDFFSLLAGNFNHRQIIRISLDW